MIDDAPQPKLVKSAHFSLQFTFQAEGQTTSLRRQLKLVDFQYLDSKPGCGRGAGRKMFAAKVKVQLAGGTWRQRSKVIASHSNHPRGTNARFQFADHIRACGAEREADPCRQLRQGGEYGGRDLRRYPEDSTTVMGCALRSGSSTTCRINPAVVRSSGQECFNAPNVLEHSLENRQTVECISQFAMLLRVCNRQSL